MLQKIFNFSKKNLIGIDISSTHVKLLELNNYKKEFEIIAHANIEFGNDLQANNENDVLIAALKKAVLESKTKTKNVAVALTHSAIINKTINLNCKLNNQEIDQLIALNAEKYLGLCLDSVGIDYCIDNNNLQIVAVRKERINKIISLLTAANLTPKIVDIDSFALERAIRATNNLSNKIIAAINLNSKSILMCVLDSKKLLYANEVFFEESQLNNAELIILQIKKLLLLFSSTQNIAVQQIILCGEKNLNPVQLENLKSEININVNYALPFAQAKLCNSSAMMICYGLALRKFIHENN